MLSAIFHVASRFPRISCYIAETWIAFLTGYDCSSNGFAMMQLFSINWISRDTGGGWRGLCWWGGGWWGYWWTRWSAGGWGYPGAHHSSPWQDQEKVSIGRDLGCPFISLRSETKRNGSENERSEIAKKRFSFACFASKRNRLFCMRNEIIRSEKYRKKGFKNTSQTSEDYTVYHDPFAALRVLFYLSSGMAVTVLWVQVGIQEDKSQEYMNRRTGNRRTGKRRT